jgi:hypothetical protein
MSTNTNDKPFLVQWNWTVSIEIIYIDRSRDSYRECDQSYWANSQRFDTAEEAQAFARSIVGAEVVAEQHGGWTAYGSNEICGYGDVPLCVVTDETWVAPVVHYDEVPF